MPVLTRFPGGGGDTGYKHYIGNTKNISVKTGAANTVCLNWEDPENFIVDGNALSEWKGCIVVAKEGTPPRSVDDGIRVAEVTEKNKYKVAQLITEIGGPGYYYGIFPYTKDFVVNENTSNAQLLEATLENSSWGLIDYASRNGQASALWSVGDEKEINLTGDYSGKLVVQIADFSHDDLAEGGKSGITFVSKNVIGNFDRDTGDVYNFWAVSKIRTKFAAIKESLPSDLQAVIKTIKSTCINAATSSDYSEYYTTINEQVTLCSAKEIGLTGTSVPQSEGTKYPVFDEKNLIRNDRNGNAASWWTRSPIIHKSSPIYWIIVQANGSTSDSMDFQKHPACIKFCV